MSHFHRDNRWVEGAFTSDAEEVGCVRGTPLVSLFIWWSHHCQWAPFGGRDLKGNSWSHKDGESVGLVYEKWQLSDRKILYQDANWLPCWSETSSSHHHTNINSSCLSYPVCGSSVTRRSVWEAATTELHNLWGWVTAGEHYWYPEGREPDSKGVTNWSRCWESEGPLV